MSFDLTNLVPRQSVPLYVPFSFFTLFLMRVRRNKPNRRNYRHPSYEDSHITHQHRVHCRAAPTDYLFGQVIGQIQRLFGLRYSVEDLRAALAYTYIFTRNRKFCFSSAVAFGDNISNSWRRRKNRRLFRFDFLAPGNGLPKTKTRDKTSLDAANYILLLFPTSPIVST